MCTRGQREQLLNLAAARPAYAVDGCCKTRRKQQINLEAFKYTQEGPRAQE